MATIGERIIEALGGITAQRLQEATSSAFAQGYYDGNDDPASGDIKGGGFGYRRQTSGQLRDFSKATPDQILETVWTLWQSSLIAKRAITLKRDHLVGTGSEYETNDKKLQEILDDFYENNELGDRILEFALQLRLLGEQIYPAFVRKADGRTTLGYIDPGAIYQVITHPDNAMERWIVVCGKSYDKKAYRIIRKDKQHFVYEAGEVVVKEANHPGKLVTHEQAAIQPWELETLKAMGINGYSGSVFFFPINCLSNQPRGYSDLVQAADWVDQTEETLFAMLDREQMAGYFSFDVTLSGADDTTVRTRAKELRSNPPSKGSVNVHNDTEEWEMWAPDLKQAASISAFVAGLTFVMGGLGFPVAYYGYGDDTNRSTLQEQSTPSEKTLESDQAHFEKMMLFIAQFVQDQAEIAGAYKPAAKADNQIRFPLPAIRSEDIKGIVQAFTPLIAGLIQAQDGSMISQETAARIAHQMLNEMGADIDTEQELKSIDDDDIDKEQANNDKLKAMMQNAQPQNGVVQNGTPQPVSNGNA